MPGAHCTQRRSCHHEGLRGGVETHCVSHTFLRVVHVRVNDTHALIYMYAQMRRQACVGHVHAPAPRKGLALSPVFNVRQGEVRHFPLWGTCRVGGSRVLSFHGRPSMSSRDANAASSHTYAHAYDVQRCLPCACKTSVKRREPQERSQSPRWIDTSEQRQELFGPPHERKYSPLREPQEAPGPREHTEVAPLTFV